MGNLQSVMQPLADLFSSFNYGLLFVWLLRFSLFLIIVGLLVTPKKKTNLKQIISAQQDGRMESRNPIVRKAESMMEHSIFKGFRITDKKEYDKIQQNIDAAGGLENATPNTIQFFRIMIPLVIIFIALPTYFLNVQVQNHRAIEEANAAEKLEQVVMSDSNLETVEAFLGTSNKEVTMAAAQTRTVNPLVILWLIILPMITYFVPDLYLKYLSRQKVQTMKSEIPTFRTFAVSMLETKTYPVYDILQILVGSTTYLKQDLMDCMNEYFVDSKAALKHLHDKVDDKEFHIVCNGLIQAVDEDKDTTLVFLQQQLQQYDTLKRLKEQEKIKKKPNFFVIVLGMPLVCILVIWFYPWFLDAMNVLGSL